MKWRQYPADILPLWVAEMDVLLAPPIVAALRTAIDEGDTGYSTGDDYARALDGFARRRWGWDGVVIERTAVAADVMQGVVEVIKCLNGPGDPVVFNCPVYAPFYGFIEHMDREVVEAPLGADGRVDIDILRAAFKRAVHGGRRAVYLLCNPHNPTGTVHTLEELTAVAELARAYAVRVVADEIHAPLVLASARHVPYLSVPGAENAVSVMSASKAWNLAGLRAALVVAGSEAADDVARIPEEVSHGPNHLGVIANTAALREGGAWLDALLAGLDENRRLLGELVREHLPGVRCRPPEGTFLAWLDCRALGLGDGDASQRGLVTLVTGPAAVFLERGRVAVTAGEAFGPGGAGHVRLNFGTSPEILEQAVTRMAAALRAV